MKLPALLPLLSLAVLSTTLLRADLQLPTIFSDHMVLQQGKPVPVWGWGAEADQKILVTFGKQRAETKADADGEWAVTLDSLKASSEPAVLAAHAGGDRIAFKDVLVGEVWLASGQSNMYWPLEKTDDADAVIEAANFPQIRLFKTNMTTSSAPSDDVTAVDDGWVACEPSSAAHFSAVGFYYGRALHRELKVPIGIIQSAWNGTRVEAWTSRATLIDVPAATPLLVDWKIEELAWSPETAATEYKAKLAAWEKQSALIKENNAKLEKGKTPTRLPRKPSPAVDPTTDRHHPSALFNAMIYPLIPYAIQGAIWYQGESNHTRAEQYATLFPAMIEDWRIHWDDDFSFYFAQLANFKPASEEPGIADAWAEIQWSQFLTEKNVEGTGMAVINDIGLANNVHPTNKADVGERLARHALVNDYGKKLVASGPIYKGHKKEGNAIRVQFDNAEGLKAVGGKKLNRFEIAGSDKKWFWADAKIDGDSIVVSSAKVKKPVAVRYAWASNPEGANLSNTTGIPASLFRTDDWPLKTADSISPFRPTEEEEEKAEKAAPKKAQESKPADPPAKKKERKGKGKGKKQEEDKKKAA